MEPTIVEATHPSEEKIQKYYAWRASNYDAGSSFEIEHHLEAIRLAEIMHGQHVLDVAYGTEAMLGQARTKINNLQLGSRVHFKQGNARELPFPDGTFDLLYNGYMFDLIPIEGFLPILKEFVRVIKPGGKLVLVNMSKPHPGKTFYETVYEKGWAVMPCRPVLMSPLLGAAGFTDVTRQYRPSHGLIVSRLWGSEIVMAKKPG